VILYDEANGDIEVESYLRSHSQNGEFIWYKGEFNRHFADWKNSLKDLCRGDYIFFLDADEIPHEDLIQTLPEILEINPDMDVFLVPRINTVDGIGLSHVKYKWKWSVSKFESMVEKKEFDLDNPQDLDEYNLLKEYNLIIEEN
jgi:hypothetical protein